MKAHVIVGAGLIAVLRGPDVGILEAHGWKGGI